MIRYSITIKCDKCKKQISKSNAGKLITQTEVIEFVNHARSLGWQIGEKQICPDCQRVKTKIWQEILNQQAQKPVRKTKKEENKSQDVAQYSLKEREQKIYRYLIDEVEPIEIIRCNIRPDNLGYLELDADIYDSGDELVRVKIYERKYGGYYIFEK